MIDGDTFKDWWGCVSFVRRRKRMVSSPSRGWLVDRFKTRKTGEHLRREQDLAPAAVQESDTGLFKHVSLCCSNPLSGPRSQRIAHAYLLWPFISSS